MTATKLPVKSAPATLAFARGLFTRGTDAFGIEEVKKVFEVLEAEVPPVTFTEEELRQGRKLGQYLRLQVNRTRGGSPLTMKAMYDRSENRLGEGKLLYDIGWYEKESFFTNETPEFGWKLVSREAIPGSTGQNYIGQTEAIAKYLTTQVYGGQDLPPIYRSAVDEFSSRREELEELIQSDWARCAQECAALQVNQLFRESPVEVLYGLVLQHEINHEYLLGNMYTWTKRCSSFGRLVDVGNADPVGMYVGGGNPRGSNSRLGVCFSRSAAPDLVS